CAFQKAGEERVKENQPGIRDDPPLRIGLRLLRKAIRFGTRIAAALPGEDPSRFDTRPGGRHFRSPRPDTERSVKEESGPGRQRRDPERKPLPFIGGEKRSGSFNKTGSFLSPDDSFR